MASIRKNGYYADPALGTAFDNLASAFAAPSGSDLAGYATASAVRNKDDRIASLFLNPNDPDFDRKNIAVGNLTGLNTIGAQNQNDATTRRNADVAAKSASSVANINNAGALARQFAQPVSAKDGETIYLPAQTAAATDLPGMFRGNISAKPGETVTTPIGEVLKGSAIPLTDSQIVGAITGKLPASDQRAIAMKGIGVSPIVGKDGEAVNVLTPDAAGSAPYIADTKNRQTSNYTTADGKSGIARYDNATEDWIDTSSKLPVPQGSKLVQGPGTSVNVSTEKTGQAELAKQAVDAHVSAQNAARESQKRLGLYDTFEKAAQGFTPGATAETRLLAKWYLKDAGLIKGDDVPDGEVLQMISRALAVHAQPKGQGAVSNFERELFAKSLPNMTQSPDGLRQAIGIQRKLEQFDMSVATIYRDSARANKGLPDYLDVQDKIAALGSPLGDAEMAAMQPGGVPPGGAPAAPTSAASAASSKPATVTQNGHTYSLQPDGSYK